MCPSVFPLAVATAALLSIALLPGCALRRPAEDERLALQADLKRDPVEVLRVIGNAPDISSAEQAAGQVRGELSPRQQLRLLRFGFGSTDERVVFGATVLMSSDRLPVPEMRNAARIVAPRIGAADCPVDWRTFGPLIGSGDIEAIAEGIPRLSQQEAVWFLGALHRMVRPDAVTALCRLALRSEGAIRRAAFDNAELAVRYSGQHVQLLVETWLQLVGRWPVRQTEGDGAGMPATLVAALRAYLELPTDPEPAEGEPDRRRASLPEVVCARWLFASTPAAHDLALLRDLLAVKRWDLHQAAAWATGAVHGEPARLVLRGAATDGDEEEVVITAALARNGDADALTRLLESDGVGLCFGLALASPVQRRAYFESFLTLPVDRARAIVLQWSRWAGGQEYDVFALPSHDDRYFDELVPLLVDARGVDTRVLRGLIAALPCCETQRLADALLARPADELFAPLPEQKGVDLSDGLGNFGGLGLGRGGVWAFLEVSRPQAFRSRLREGLRSEQADLRATCAHLLLRIGDGERIDELVAWIESAGDHTADLWLELARIGNDSVRRVLHERLLRAEAPDESAARSAALAMALGVPVELTEYWPSHGDVAARVRDALLAGDVQRALLCALGELDDLYVGLVPVLADWPDPVVRNAARARIDRCDADAQQLFAMERHWALVAGDRTTIESCMEPLHDGRYATHDFATMQFAARAGGLAMLPFWIDELGTNCCKVAEIEEVPKLLFGSDCGAFQRSELLEPASTCLRRTLLPCADRLRWSHIANGFVVAGR